MSEVPNKVETKPTTRNDHKGYELIDPKFESDKIPLHIDDLDDYYDVRGLYNPKCDIIEVPSEEVKFKINIIEELDQLEIVKKEHNTIPSNLLDTFNHHEIICSYTKPCQLTNEQSYGIIRSYIKENINNKVATITSDYDFCFRVEKKIKLAEEVRCQVDVNNSVFDKRKRKPKFVEKCKESKHVIIFDMAPKVYQSYTLITPFKGDNYQDMMDKIDSYLKNLIDFINEPVVECIHCKGTGITLDLKWGVK